MPSKIKRDKASPISAPVVLLILFILSTAVTKHIKPEIFQGQESKTSTETAADKGE